MTLSFLRDHLDAHWTMMTDETGLLALQSEPGSCLGQTAVAVALLETLAHNLHRSLRRE